MTYGAPSTHDEPAHFAAGCYDWSYSGRELYDVNPPLVRMCDAFPASWVFDATGMRKYVENGGLTDWGGGAEQHLWGTDGGRAEFWLSVGRCVLIPFAFVLDGRHR